LTQKKNKEAYTPECKEGYLWRIISNLPITLGIMIAVFGAVCVILLLLESFRAGLIFGLGIPASLLVFIIVNRVLVPDSRGSRTERRLVDVLAILFVVVWGVFNSAYTAQNIYLYRDPALYNTTARWLIEHDNIAIPSVNYFGENDQILTTSNAGVNSVEERPGRLYTHGQRLLPTLSASLGKVTQEAAALKVNILIGSLALLSFYGFTRLFTRPRWSLLATMAFSVSLPMLYFSRDMYTEIISMLFFFTMLSLVYFAKKTNKYLFWIISGFMAGAMTMTRIDAYIGLAGIFVYLIAYILFQPEKDIYQRLKRVGIFFIGFFITASIAWLDLTQLGLSYFRFHQTLIFQQIILLLIIALFGLMLFFARKTKIYKITVSFCTSRNLKAIGTVLIIFVVAILTARPYLIGEERYYEVQNIGGTESVVRQDTITNDSVTYYSGEAVVMWPTWYLGAIMSIAALVGLIIAVRKSVNNPDLYLLPILLSFLSVAILYFYHPSITPDHIWASRRILPVVLPSMAFFAVYAMHQYYSKKKIVNVAIYIAAGAVFIVGSLSTSWFFVQQRTEDNMLTQINELCRVLPDNSAVLLLGHLGLVGTQTVYSYCQVPTVRYIGSRVPNRQEFLQFYQEAISNNKIPVVVMFNNDKGLLMQGSETTDLTNTPYKTVEKVFSAPPTRMIETEKQLTIVILNPDGTGRSSLQKDETFVNLGL
jgi:hypothetical protein